MLISLALGIGFGISFINKKKKLFFSGVFALLTFAAIYHGIFNMLQKEEQSPDSGGKISGGGNASVHQRKARPRVWCSAYRSTVRGADPFGLRN